VTAATTAVTLLEAELLGLLPKAFVAKTVKVYEVPPESPETVILPLTA
jgi:hypothetical protein